MQSHVDFGKIGKYILLCDAIKKYEKNAEEYKVLARDHGDELFELYNPKLAKEYRDKVVECLQLKAWLEELEQRRASTEKGVSFAVEHLRELRESYDCYGDESFSLDNSWDADYCVRHGIDIALDEIVKHTGEAGVGDEKIAEQCESDCWSC